MTCTMMQEFGCRVREAGVGCWEVPRCGYNRISHPPDDSTHVDGTDQDFPTGSSPPTACPRLSSSYVIEPDASSATYFLAMAAVTGAFTFLCCSFVC